MSLINAVLGKRKLAILTMAVAAVAVFVFSRVLADSGPVTMNANPQGLVTSDSVKLTMDTADLARCRYSKEDADYDDMDDMTTPDGLYHYVSLGSLSDGSYTYYARCKDFMGEANEESTEFKFKVGDLGGSDDDDEEGCSSDSDCVSGQTCKNRACTTASSGGDTTAPVISSPLPLGTLYDPYVTLSVATSEPASCRFSWLDKTYDSMTLNFESANRYYHTSAQQLSQYGYFVVFVRCKDDAGNVNAYSTKISFRYASRTINTGSGGGGTTTPKDTTAPVISSLSPSGDVKAATTTISCITDEKATCKYDTKDVEYDELANLFDADSTGKIFSKSISLDKAGSYTYYVRCKDQAGNKSTASSQIGFTYVIPVVEGPKISNLQPSGGTIYQKNVALILQTDKAADCRYSKDDVDYDDMEEKFSTNDGLLQQATMTLDEFGEYTFYVRCADKEGNKDDVSEVASFTYKDSNAPNDEDITVKCEDDSDCKDGKTCQDGSCKKPKETATVECKEITSSKKDGACDKIADCICDPDCPLSGDDVDADCANVKPAQDNRWIVLLLIGIVLVVVIVIIIAIIKKRGSDEEDVELP